MLWSSITRLEIPTPISTDHQCLPISARQDFNEHAHVQTSARTVNRSRNFKSVHDPILKSFNVVKVHLGRFDIMYGNPWQLINYPSQSCLEVLTQFS